MAEEVKGRVMAAASSASEIIYFRLKICLMNSAQLTIYFDSSQMRDKCYQAILQEQGFGSQIDQYIFASQPLRNGNSSVIQATHKLTQKPVVIKVFSKAAI